MALGVRSGATILSPQLQPNSISSYDPITRRNTILVANIVPTLALSDSVISLYQPADRYYLPLGALASSSNLPGWMSAPSNVTFQNWDASDLRYYAAFANAAGSRQTGVNFFHYAGVLGAATSFAPKNLAVTTLRLQFRARFSANADYDTYGIGLSDQVSVSGRFNTATDRNIQVLRNAGAWELGSSDGTTLSQSSGGTANGSLHDFEVKWSAAALTLYVDGTSTITKTTNLPTRVMQLVISAVNGTNSIDVVDVLASWE